jgi:hypothetical protein
MKPDPTPVKYTVELTYFRASGKYYAGGSYETTTQSLQGIWDEITDMYDHPGLSSYWRDIILVNVPDHPHAHPKLLMMDNMK